MTMEACLIQKLTQNGLKDQNISSINTGQECSIVGEHLPSMHQALGLIPRTETNKNKNTHTKLWLQNFSRPGGEATG